MMPVLRLTAIAWVACIASPASAQSANGCEALPSHEALREALVAAQAEPNGGLGFSMWATLVDRDGIVCSIAMSGASRGEQWPGSRLISAQKANTANAFSLPAFALSTANLFSAVQPGGSLFGLQESNPVNLTIAYSGNPALFGSARDPLVGTRIGGINVFGGGLALYDSNGRLLGGLGVSGDTSCADHNIAWRVRRALGLGNVPNGVANRTDAIIHDIADGRSASGYGHPLCSPESQRIATDLASSPSP